ncbi:MMS19 nucleotide excision repair protein homolog [Striga asiatica]|uniref:MMS19 nucleotide excision repair protein homolog n=1 Tax=Striga asiatica TaxID=4170 RepID=A0A5A7R977_STRAF|nr:MMS19 nucleotide excision repair protein homolog [Striga asiatica]
MLHRKPNLHIADPPEVSRLSMVRQMDVKDVPCGIISCTDKALVLLFAGLPGVHKGYLVYDASSKSISWIPSLPGSLNCMLRTAILSLGKGSYLLAELVRGPELGLVTLYKWRSTSNTRRGRWIRSAARPPPHLFMTNSFHIDMVFSYGSSSVCWVDLLRGVLICDLLKSPEPEFTFVPLPLGYCIDVPSEPCQGRPRTKEFRTMGCIGGVIKFVTVVGYHGNHSYDDMLLKTWTLSPDHKDPDDAEIVNVTLSDIEYEKKVDFFGKVHRGRMLLKAQYLVSINTVKNKVLSSCKLTHEYPRPKFLDLTASDLSAYVQDSKDVCKVLFALIAFSL